MARRLRNSSRACLLFDDLVARANSASLFDVLRVILGENYSYVNWHERAHLSRAEKERHGHCTKEGS